MSATRRILILSKFGGRPMLAVGAATAALLLAFPFYHAIQALVPKRNSRSGYGICLVDTKGRRVSKLRGQVQLMLDPFCLFRLRPDQSDARFEIDSRGFRRTLPDNGSSGKDSPKAAILGGSTAFGYLLDSDADTVASRLTRTFPEVQFLHAACPGHLSGQELAMMIHYLDPHRPQAYIVIDGWNEVMDQDFGQPRQSDQFGFNNSFFMLEDRLRLHHLRVDPQRRAGPTLRDMGPAPDVDSAGYRLTLAEAYVANLERMNAFAKARNAKFLVAFQPELGSKRRRTPSEERILETWDRHGYVARKMPEKYQELVRFAEARCKALKIDAVNLLDDPRFRDETTELFKDPVHLNERGHALLAEAVATWLERAVSTPPSLAN